MKNIYDVQRDLLGEIDNICKTKGFRYFMIRYSAKNAYESQSLEGGPLVVSIAMIQGEAEELALELIKQNDPNRYVEWVLNNPYFVRNHFSYGAKNSTTINLSRKDDLINHGIHVNVYYIEKYEKKGGQRVVPQDSSFDRTRKSYNGLVKFHKNNMEATSLKKYARKTVYELIDKFVGIETLTKKLYRERYKIWGFSNWSDVENYKSVTIRGHIIPIEWIINGEEYIIDNRFLVLLPNPMDKYLDVVFGYNWQERIRSNYRENIASIIAPELPFADATLLLESNSIIKNYDLAVNTINTNRECVKEEAYEIKRLHELVFMTKEQVHFEKYFENHAGEAFCDSEIRDDVIFAIEKYAEYDMTFRLDSEIERQIDTYLEKLNKLELVNKLKTLRKIDVFVGK